MGNITPKRPITLTIGIPRWVTGISQRIANTQYSPNRRPCLARPARRFKVAGPGGQAVAVAGCFIVPHHRGAHDNAGLPKRADSEVDNEIDQGWPDFG